LPHPTQCQSPPASQSASGKPREGIQRPEVPPGAVKRKLGRPCPELPPAGSPAIARRWLWMCARRGIRWSMVRIARQPADPLARNWEHGPLRSPRINPRGSATPQSARSWGPAPLKAGRSPWWPTSRRLRALAGQWHPLNFAERLHPHSLRPQLLEPHDQDPPNPTPSGRPAQSDHQRSSTCARAVEFSSDRSAPQHSPLTAGPNPPSEGPLGWFARAANHKHCSARDWPSCCGGDTLNRPHRVSARHRPPGTGGAADPQTAAGSLL